LNYKGIPYTQSFISYPDIASLLKSLDVPPLPGHKIPYTLPAVVHPSVTSNKHGALNDSLPIALHLDEAFPAPEYPALFPSDGSYALAAAVDELISVGYRMVLPKVPHILDPRGREYFNRTRSERFGKPLAEVAPKGEELAQIRKTVEARLSALADMLKGKEGKKGPFFDGETPGYADLVLVATLAWFERADHADWERMVKVGGGELRRLWDACLPWLDAQGEEKEWAI